MEQKNLRTYTVADLFCGGGGIRQASESTGRTRNIFSSELDSFAQDTYQANFGERPAGDILAVDPAKLPRADIVLGGPPCQDFSVMGKRAGLTGQRGALTLAYAKFLAVQKPLTFLMENVVGLVSADGGKTLERVKKLMRRAGYTVYTQILDARDFGSPQKRRRLFLVGFRNDLNVTSFAFPEGGLRPAAVGSVLEQNVDSSHWLSVGYAASLEARTARNEAKGNGFGMVVLDTTGPANTLTVGGSGRERNLIAAKAPAGSGKSNLRRLTVREYARIQGFPDTFRFPVSDTQAYKQIGNSVAVPVVAALITRVVETLDAILAPKTKKPKTVRPPNKIKGLLSGLKFADLFAGVGAFHVAMKALGMDCAFASEWNMKAAKVYEDNNGTKPKGDITKIDAREIPTHAVLCAGFPCQPFSVSGQQLGFADTRGTLFFDVARIAKEKQPDVVFLENVRNLAGHDDGKTLGTILATLEEIGYDTFHKVINAADLGFPTARQRIYIVGFRKDIGIAADMFRFPNSAAQRTVVADCLETLSATETAALRVGTIRSVDKRKAVVAAQTAATNPSEPVRIGTLGNGGQGYRIYSPAGVGITLSAYGGGAAAKTGAYLINGTVRRLSPRECANMMGFPKTFRLDESPNQAYQQLGNSVVVGVVAAIAKEIERALTLAVKKRCHALAEDCPQAANANCNDASAPVCPPCNSDVEHRNSTVTRSPAVVDPTKREHGRYYTTGDPLRHPAFHRWYAQIPLGARFVEPCAGAGHLVAHLRSHGIGNPVDCFDLQPPSENHAGVPVVRRDTLADFPQGYDVVVTNPPYLSRPSATKLGVAFPTDCGKAGDLYEVALGKALAASPYVAVVIPGSFVRSGLFRDRLEAVIELEPGCFGDTSHPACLALFGSAPSADYEIWQGHRLVGMASALVGKVPTASSGAAWSFNNPKGQIALRALDSSAGESIAFAPGSDVPSAVVKKTSKAVTRISGIPKWADVAAVIARANALFRAWRQETAGVFICPFDGKRRRLDFTTARRFLDAALADLSAMAVAA